MRSALRACCHLSARHLCRLTWQQLLSGLQQPTAPPKSIQNCLHGGRRQAWDQCCRRCRLLPQLLKLLGGMALLPASCPGAPATGFAAMRHLKCAAREAAAARCGSALVWASAAVAASLTLWTPALVHHQQQHSLGQRPGAGVHFMQAAALLSGYAHCLQAVLH